MDGIEEIIGILLLALLGSAGKLFGAKKRKRKVFPKTESGPVPVSDPADLEPDDRSAGADVLPENGGFPDPSCTVSPMAGPDGDVPEIDYPSSPLREKDSVLQEKGKDEAGNSRPDSGTFSLRDAVIAKTLLERKYF